MSDRWMDAFTKICEADGLDTVGLPLPEGTTDQAVTRSLSLPLDPLDWLSEIARASGYVGVRFHPVLCSIISGIPVVALDRYYRSVFDSHRSKTLEVMSNFGLRDFCFGRWHVRTLKPARVMRLLQEQSRGNGGHLEIVRKLDDELRNFIRFCIESI